MENQCSHYFTLIIWMFWIDEISYISLVLVVWTMCSQSPGNYIHSETSSELTNLCHDLYYFDDYCRATYISIQHTYFIFMSSKLQNVFFFVFLLFIFILIAVDKSKGDFYSIRFPEPLCLHSTGNVRREQLVF